MTVEQIIEQYPYLTEDDFGNYEDEGRAFTILEESGRQKLIKEEGISYHLDCQQYHPDGHAVVKCKATVPERKEVLDLGSGAWAESISKGRSVDALGSVNPRTSNYPFFVEVAEKRALDRAIRKLTGLGANVMGRNEIHKSFTAEVSKDGEVKTTPAGQEFVQDHIKKTVAKRRKNAKQDKSK